MPIGKIQRLHIAGFTITKIVIIQSLSPGETATGRILHEYIDAQIKKYPKNIGIEFLTCNSADEFLQILNDLTHQAENSHEIPLLQVECHGDDFDGLVFADNSFLTWPDLSSALTDLNRACRFNLLAIFSACYGGYFLSQMDSMSPAPCWALIAPTHQVDPGEVMQVIRMLYLTFLQKEDIGKAIRKISKIRMNEGRWFGQPAEIWFESLMIGYIKKHCSHRMVRKRSKKIYRELRKKGQHRSIGNIKRWFKQRHRNALLKEYFDLYFMIDAIPENRHRFSNAYKRLEHKISELRGQGRYVL